MLNPRLDILGPGPFQRLAALLDGVAPAAGGRGPTIEEPIMRSRPIAGNGNRTTHRRSETRRPVLRGEAP